MSLGIRKHVIREEQSLSIGFNISRENEQLFSFEALTYYPDGVTERIAFLTLFPIQNIMRANLFVYRNLEEEWVKRFKSNPHEELMRTLPGLEKFTGPFGITSKIEMRPVDLYKVSGHIQPGVVLVGDAFQSVCPTTGMGLSKVLTDVDVLAECVPEWLRTAGMSNEKLADYYTHSRKRVCDAQSIRRAQNCRAMSTDSSFFWRALLELLLLAGRLIG